MKAKTPHQLLDLLGISNSPRTNRLALCCPFHHDRNPSASFYLDTKKFYCFACNLSMDMVTFYVRIKGCTREEARAELGIEKGDGRVGIDIRQVEIRTTRMLRDLRGRVSNAELYSLGEERDKTFWQAEREEASQINVDAIVTLIEKEWNRL